MAAHESSTRAAPGVVHPKQFRIWRRSPRLFAAGIATGAVLIYWSSSPSPTRTSGRHPWSHVLDRRRFSTWTLVGRHDIGSDAALLTFRPLQTSRTTGDVISGQISRLAQRAWHALGQPGATRAASDDQTERTAEINARASDRQAVMTCDVPRTIYDDLFAHGTWSVQVVHPGLNVAREYTPLPPLLGTNADDEREQGLEPTSATQEDLSLYIRKQGETSRYLYGLDLGSTVKIRGPEMSLRHDGDLRSEGITPDTRSDARPIREVLFIAGGTGIAPALQLLHGLHRFNSGHDAQGTAYDPASNPGEHSEERQSAGSIARASFTLLWANRSRETCVGGATSPELAAALGGTSENSSAGISARMYGLFRSNPAPPANGFARNLSRASPMPIATGSGTVTDNAQVTSPIVTHLRLLEQATAARRSLPVTTTTTPDATTECSSAPPSPRYPSLQTAFFVDDERIFITPLHLRNLLRASVARAAADGPAGDRGQSDTKNGIAMTTGKTLEGQVLVAMQTKEQRQRKLLVVSGPPGLVAYLAGPTTWENGTETQGPLGGVLGQLRREGVLRDDWEVWKL